MSSPEIASARNSNAEGTVWLECMVDGKGAIRRPGINKPAEYSLGEEALRLISISHIQMQRSAVWK